MGAKVAEAPEEGDAVLIHGFDLQSIAQLRDNWFVFRDRRPDLYGGARHAARRRLTRSSRALDVRGRASVPGRGGREPPVGGGGGTAHPWLSPRAGLCLRPRTAGRRVDAERVIRLVMASWILVPPGRGAVGGSMSLYRAGLRVALFLPLGVAMPPLVRGAVRFHRCELRCQPNLAIWRDPRIEPPSASPRLQIYVRSSLIVSRAALPEEQGRRNASGQ